MVQLHQEGRRKRKDVLIFKVIFQTYQAIRILKNVFAALFHSVHQQKGDAFQIKDELKDLKLPGLCTENLSSLFIFPSNYFNRSFIIPVTPEPW